jgi:hypothetical protein
MVRLVNKESEGIWKEAARIGKGYGREQPWSNLKYCLGIHLEGQRKTIKQLRIISDFVGIQAENFPNKSRSIIS